MADEREQQALRRAVAASLGRLGFALQLIAEEVLGEEDGLIDWIGAGPDGRAWLVLVDPDADGTTLLERALVQRAWVAARAVDWCKLAPSLGLRPELAPHVVLVAASFSRATRIAAREAAGDAIVLVRLQDASAAPGPALALEVVELPPLPRRGAAPASPRLRSVFRTGLSDADLAN